MYGKLFPLTKPESVNLTDKANNSWLQPKGVFVYETWTCWKYVILHRSHLVLLRFISTTAPYLRTRCPMWTAQERNTASNSCFNSSHPMTMKWESNLIPPISSVCLFLPASFPSGQFRDERREKGKADRMGLKMDFYLGHMSEMLVCLFKPFTWQWIIMLIWNNQTSETHVSMWFLLKSWSVS